MTEAVLPQHTNALGSVFGGVVMSWMDICAAICAQRHARCPVVTASVDELHFLKPIDMGDTVMLEAHITATGRTSMEIHVVVSVDHLYDDREPDITTEAYFTFVAIGKDGKPTPVPKLEDPEEQAPAEARKEARLRKKRERMHR